MSFAERHEDMILFEAGLYFSHLPAQHYLQTAETVGKNWPRMLAQGEHIVPADGAFPRCCSTEMGLTCSPCAFCKYGNTVIPS